MSNIKPGSTNYWHLGGKIDPISEIKNAGVLTSGNVYWVKDPSDNDYLEFKDSVGADNLFDTIAAALAVCKSDENDYVFVCPKKDGSAWTITTALTLNQDKVHLISLGYNPKLNGTGYSNTLQGFGTSDTTTVPTAGFLNITGNGCEVAGFRLLATAGTSLLGSVGADGGTAGLITIASNGNYFHDLAIERTGAAWDDGTPSHLIMAGSTKSQQLFENVFVNAGTQTASAMGMCRLPQSGLGWEFKNCTFLKTGNATTDHPFTGGAGTANGIAASFEDCKFVFAAGGTAPAMVLGGSMPVGAYHLFKDCMGVNVTNFGTGDGVKITPSFAGGTINNLLQNPGIAIPGTALIVTKT